MTNMEVKQLLDDLLPPTKKQAQKVKMNANLTTAQVDALCSFVSDFEAAEENFDWKGNLKRVTNIATKYQAKTIEVANAMNNSGTLPNTSNTMPFMVIQVLYYIGVACGLYEKDGKRLASQSDIISELSANKLSLSHNFYSRLGVESYLKMIRYRQPAVPFNYAGQKNKELGVAIKHLVHQAGSYDVFIDVFGGSGAASVAFPRRNNAVYIYNDLNKDLANLFDIISDDDKHLILIDYLTKLQEDLRGERDEWNPYDFDFKEEARKYYSLRNSENTDSEIRIIKDTDGVVENDLNSDSIIGCMHTLYEKVTENKEIYEGSSDFLETCFGQYITTKNPYSLIMSYFQNYKYIYDFIDINFIPIELSNIKYRWGSDDEEVLSTREHHVRSNQLRFYEWYAVFSNVLKNGSDYKTDDIFKGVGTIYIRSFITQGHVDMHSIFSIYIGSEELYNSNKEEGNTWIKFLNTDFKSIIKNLYSRIKKNKKSLARNKASTSSRKLSTRTVVENLDCIELINKYRTNGVVDIKHNKPLFYLDSPYISTRGYEVGAFTSEDMRCLIEKLAETNDRFIFSCRACKSKSRNSQLKKDTKKDPLEELKQGNRNILDAVFGNFEKAFNTKYLRVLTISNSSKKNKTDFWELVRTNKIAEVMIVNFEISSFSDNQFKSVDYKVYEFTDFLDILKANINK